MTINAEVIRMLKTSICRASYYVPGDFKITSRKYMKHPADIFPLTYFDSKLFCEAVVCFT